MLHRPILAYDSEVWTPMNADERQVIAGELGFMRSAGYTLKDYQRNEDYMLIRFYINNKIIK